MSDYAIGDVQGCYDPLMRLLDVIDFNEHQDRLWFVGDLVNRGPQSLEVLRFIKQLPQKPFITLGNHDLHLLGKIFTEHSHQNHDDTLHTILAADDREELGHWLRMQSILIHDMNLNVLMCHAGIAPVWTLSQAKQFACELEASLHSPDFLHFLQTMYGNKPDHWQDSLTGYDRLRLICNYFTRMRFCDQDGNLVLSYKGTIAAAPPELIPWFALQNRISIDADIVFGHWAALQGYSPIATIHAIDTGCLWGGPLTALRLQDKQRFTTPGLSSVRK